MLNEPALPRGLLARLPFAACVATWLAVACLAVPPTPEELSRVKAWTDLLFPQSDTPPPKPHVGIAIVHASHLTKLNENAWGQPLTLGARRIDHGVYVDAPNHLRVTLPKPAARFTAQVGIDNNPDTRRGQAAGHGSATFHILVGEKEIARTDVLTLKNSPQMLDVRLDGGRILDLRVGSAGDRSYDQSVWGDAQVTFVDGTSMLLDEFPLLREMKPQLPFSFVYDGTPSSKCLPDWQRTIHDKRIDASRVQRTITYKDPKTGLVCEVQAVLFDQHPAIEWLLRFRNEGSTDTPILSSVRTLDAVWPIDPADRVRLYRLKGSTCRPDDFQPMDAPVAKEKSITFAPVGGRSSNGVSPFFKVAWSGGGVCIGIGWSGQWQASVTRSDGLRIQAGIEQIHTTLHPGESIRLPRILLAYWSGEDHQRGHNLYRRVVIEHYMPRLGGKVVYPIIAHDSAYDELRNANEQNQMDIIRATHRAGLEGYWLDAYWFEGYFPNGVGNWAIPIEQTVRKKDYPRGVRPLSDLTHQLGMKFILWFEPERVAPGTHIDRTHADWVLRIDNKPGGVFDLGNPGARRWMTDYLCRCIDAYDMDVLRIDHNIDPLAYWRTADAPDRQGITEIRCVTGLYQMWDEILARFPKIFIDNCASGGRRIDLETNMWSIPMWRSDYNDNNTRRGDSIADQGMIMGLSLFTPLHAGPVWREDPYAWRSANVGGPIPYWDMRGDGFSREELALAVREAQELRPYFLGDLWHLTENSIDPKEWAAFQYHRPEQDDGFVCAFRRRESPYRALDVSLRGVKPERTYVLHYYPGYTEAKTETRTGKKLKTWHVEIPRRNTSLLIRYHPATQRADQASLDR